MSPQFEYIGKLSEGFKRIKQGVYPHYQCGFINENNEIVIAPQYANVQDFCEGLAAVRPGNWASPYWGFINYKGELVIPCIYEKARNFSNGLAKVVYQGQWYFINQEGKRVISLGQYSGSTCFHDGYAIVRKIETDYHSSTFGVIDTNGTEIIPCTKKCFEDKYFYSCSIIKRQVELYFETTH